MKRIFYLLAALVVFSCEYENMEQLSPCETEDVSYAEDIVPILETNCYRCHSLGDYTTFGGDILLEGYNDLTSLLSPTANIEDQYIYANVAHIPGFIPMPGASLPQIDQCSINKIKAWIENGYPNN